MRFIEEVMETKESDMHIAQQQRERVSAIS